MASLRRRPALLLLLLALGLWLLAGVAALPETVTVRVLPLEPVGAGGIAPFPSLTADSMVQCAARCLRNADCLAISYERTAATGGNCTLRGCRADWINRQRSCYLVSSEPVRLAEAAKRCRDWDAGLASVLSQGEHDFIRTLATKQSVVRVYLGLRHQGPPKNSYSENKYAWEDGSALNYTNWSEGEPYLSESERGVYLQVDKNNWHTWTADFSFNYVCKYVVQ